jgi:lipoate-protein ligase A
VERLGGGAGALHARRLPSPALRTATFLDVEAPALVLGSTQPDVAGAARRRSGGGAVWVAPGDQVWVDVVVPARDPLWSDDVGQAFGWLGDVWAAALTSLGVEGLTVHRGPLVTTRWSGDVCFAGLGPGEVTVEGRKVVGMAQRRTREWALFQCAVPLVWDPSPVVSMLGLPDEAVDDLASAGYPLGPLGLGEDDVESAFIAALPPA